MVLSGEEIQKRLNEVMTVGEYTQFIDDLIETINAKDVAIHTLSRLAVHDHPWDGECG